MKKFVCSLALIAGISLLFVSCRKEGPGRDDIRNVTLDISLAAGQTYTLDLSQYGDEDDIASITQQATVYDLSRIDLTGGKYIYSFLKTLPSKIGATDTETVMLKVAEPAGHRHCEETDITIHFTIH